MTSEISKNTIIAKNTLLLSIRMLIVMFVTFFTSRVVLEALGVTGYGVYSLIGGLAFSFGFFSSSLSNATQRYLSFAHGHKNENEVKAVFNATALFYIILGGAILSIGCIIGPWLISSVTIPESLVNSAYWIYYCGLVSLTVTLTATMFDSVLIARENMKVYAYLSIFDVLGKLGIAYLIYITTSSKLIAYAISLMILSIIVKGVMIYFCLNRYSECHVKLHWDKKMVKELGGFIGWNGFGTIIFTINNQGLNLILNFFFGPVVNAARGVANQVNGAINNFSSNFLLAISPQMMKSYAANDMIKFHQLFNYCARYSFALLWILFLPIILRREFILHLWLKNVPDYTDIFLLWIIIYSLVDIYINPQWFAIQAIGKLKMYMLAVNTIFLMVLPISWMCLKIGMNPEAVFQIMVIDRIVAIIASLFIIKKYIVFSISNYIIHSVCPNILAITISLPLSIIVNKLIPQSFCGLILNSLVVMTVCFICVWFIVFTHSERRKITNLIMNKFK